jgi:hypothetical protein
MNQKTDHVNVIELCNATNRNGEPCKRLAEHGTPVCHFHGAKAPQVANKGQQKQAQEKAARAAQLLGIPIEVDPHSALLDELHRTAGLVAWLAQQVEQERTAINRDDHGNTTPTTWFRLWQQERDRLIKVAESCARAGVEERRVALVEDQARVMSQLLRAVLSELGVPLDDVTTRVVRRHLGYLQSVEVLPVVSG